MYINLYWWNALIVVLGFTYLILKGNALYKTNKRLTHIIHKLEGIDEREDLTLEKEGGNGDAEGMG